MISILMLGSLLSFYQPTAYAATDDITGSTLEKDMRAMIAAGVLKGYGDGIYKPRLEVTRGQFATFISRALNLPEGSPVFTDVAPSSDLAKGIYSASAAGIVRGISATTFQPGKPISRAEAAVMIDRAFGYRKIDRGTAELNFSDAGQVSESFKQAVALNARDGIIKGLANGDGTYRFMPNQTATRQDAAAFINRMLNKMGIVVAPPVVQKGPELKVELRNFLGNKKEISLNPEVDYSTNLANIKLAANQTYQLKIIDGNIAIYNGASQLGQAPNFEITPNQGNGPIAINDRAYLGKFTLAIDPNGYIRPMNYIGLEDYLKGVVHREMPASWHMEALKAQAVTARTYALGHSKGIMDDTQRFQVYGGYDWADDFYRKRGAEAVESTEGLVISYGGSPIGSGAVFSSSNGGKTESNANAWGTTALSYLPIQDDPYDPKTPWNLSFKKQQIDLKDLDLTQADSWWGTVKEAEQSTVMNNIKTWLKANGYKDKDIKIVAVPEFSLTNKTSGGRVTKGSMTIEFLVKENGTAKLQRLELKDRTAENIRLIVGTMIMKSTLVTTLSSDGDVITVSGAGFGHGVGMSQYGAKGAADQGKTYREILSFYFEGTTVKSIY